MGTSTTHRETYLPDPGGRVARVHEFLEAHDEERRGRPQRRYFLAGSAPDDRVELPAEIYRVLRQVVEALQQGLAVTVAPVTPVLTTQQAAELLGMSRPAVIRLLDQGRIPFERVGTHRRIQLGDVMAYREQRRAEQYAALQATAVDIDDEEDLQDALEQLREARRAVAARRRARRTP